MGMNLFETLMHPDREELEAGDRRFISQAANILQVGEFQLLQLAYRDWHDREIPEKEMAKLFASYMLRNRVPSWAKHYARKVLILDERGLLDEGDPAFHRYDHEFRTRVPLGAKRLAVAVAWMALLIGGSLFLSHLAAKPSVTLLPPYFNADELEQPRPRGPADG